MVNSVKNIRIKLENNEIYADEYVSLNSKNSVKKHVGKEVYNLLNYNTRYKINNIYESGNGIQIEYDDFIISCDKGVLLHFYASPLLNRINRFSNKNNASKHKGKKVTRKNRHIGKRVIALGVLIAIICAGIAHSKKKKTVDIDEIVTTSLSQESEEESTTMQISFEQDEIIEEENSIIEEENPIFELSINYSGFQPDYDKLDYVRKNYSKTIEKYSKMYGIDPNIMIAIATQERGIHSSTMDPGGATGLMQIQNSVWVGETLKAFNYEIDDVEAIRVSYELLGDLENNIKIGCMVFANTLGQMKNNVLAAIQCYNMGYGSMMKIFNNYSIASGKSISDIMSNPSDIGWLKHRDIINMGDQHYLERILAYIGDVVNIESLGEQLTIYVGESKSKTI